TVNDSFFFHPDAQNGNSLRLGLGGALNGSVSITGNYIGGGGQATQLELWSNLTFTGNTIAAGTAPGGNDQLTFYIPMSGASELCNNNTYYNNPTGTRGYYYDVGSSSMTFSQWKSMKGFDGTSQQLTGYPTTNWTFVRPNAYDPNRAHIIIYNWTNAASITVN